MCWSSAKAIAFVWPIVWVCKTITLSYRMSVASKTIMDCLTEVIAYKTMSVASQTILDCLTEWSFQDNPWLSGRMVPADNSNCPTEVLDCLASYKIVFLLCLVLARQSRIVLPLPLCLCYSQLSCLSIVLQVQLLCL